MKTLCLYPNSFTFCIIFLVLIILSSFLSTFISYYRLLPQPNFLSAIIKVLSHLIWSNTQQLLLQHKGCRPRILPVSETCSAASPSSRLRSWLNRRQIDGSLNRTPLGFYDRVWQILERTPDGIVVAGNHLPQVPNPSTLLLQLIYVSFPELDLCRSLLMQLLTEEIFSQSAKMFCWMNSPGFSSASECVPGLLTGLAAGYGPSAPLWPDGTWAAADMEFAPSRRSDRHFTAS